MGGGGGGVKMQGCRKMLPIDTTFLLRMYFITSFSSVIFFKLVMAKLVVVFTQLLSLSCFGSGI